MLTKAAIVRDGMGMFVTFFISITNRSPLAMRVPSAVLANFAFSGDFFFFRFLFFFFLSLEASQSLKSPSQLLKDPL